MRLDDGGDAETALGNMERTALVERCLEAIQCHSIKVVAFDMDQTAVARHSQGRMERGTPLEEFCGLATPAFLAVVPALHAAGVGLAIATHSDELELTVQRHRMDPATHIIGSELANAVLTTHFHDDVVRAFHIVAYNPKVRGTKHDEANKVKRHHMKRLQHSFGVEAREILFFDDVPHIVDDCARACGVHAVLVDAKVGFQYHDLLDWAEKQVQMKP